MAKRAYSPKEVLAKTYKTLPWGPKWSVPFGEVPVNETWFISGASASGKSSFVMQLAKELCNYGTVLYLSYEEGVSMSFQERLKREKMNEVQGRFRTVVGDTYDDLVERLRRPKSAKFVIIDSFQDSKLTYEEVEALITRFHRKGFIFISQEYKGQPTGKPAGRVKYKAGIKIRVSGYKAYCQGRFTANPEAYYVVWEEGILRTSNNIG
ncbi:AAA family ATPase [Duncaniella sp. C9]|uniref:AAA family ATPase n=1 Tax=Muribaculaceae TaxID=2005473 RepID=UPI0010A549C0|nr:MULTISPECIES: AAA family ATPase [Muribaculaceae]MCX4333238.1 AAA family ATPase [Paramuribaculum sp.]QCD40604.1 AAA family ATPase [Duncaniella sp. C9]QCP71709.1 AAA family ATPase [Duncaniella sp. B8]